MKKFLPLVFLCAIFGLVVPFSTVKADCTDTDGDRYYRCESEEDELPPFAQGKEEVRCDEVTITHDTEDGDLVIAPEVESVPGRQVNPGAVEGPNSDIDYNCDGRISGYLPDNRQGDTDLMGLIEKIITVIGQIAVFVSVAALVYGGIMFATASGEDMKLQKAKKTIIGAVVGLVIGLIAWNIVGFVTDLFG